MNYLCYQGFESNSCFQVENDKIDKIGTFHLLDVSLILTSAET